MQRLIGRAGPSPVYPSRASCGPNSPRVGSGRHRGTQPTSRRAYRQCRHPVPHQDVVGTLAAARSNRCNRSLISWISLGVTVERSTALSLGSRHEGLPGCRWTGRSEHLPSVRSCLHLQPPDVGGQTPTKPVRRVTLRVRSAVAPHPGQNICHPCLRLRETHPIFSVLARRPRWRGLCRPRWRDARPLPDPISVKMLSGLATLPMLRTGPSGAMCSHCSASIPDSSATATFSAKGQVLQ